MEAVSLLGPGLAYSEFLHRLSVQIREAHISVISALSSRYIPIVLFPYYLALGAQISSSLYALVVVPETLRKQNDQESEVSDEETDDEENETVVEALVENVVEPVVEAVTVPIKPLALLLPHRGKHGALEWRLFILTMSLLATTSGVSICLA